MIISVNWLKKFIDIDMPVDELAILIGERLVEIENVEDIGQKYKDVIVAKVVECSAMEGSDHLSVTKVDDGGVVQGVERDSNGLVQVVCGAPNVKAGMLAAWLPPQSIVPDTFNNAEPFVLGAKELRGVMSNGMLASARELDLYDEHDGIIEIDKDAEPGSSFAELYELNDYLLDIENKSLTHRPDAFGVIGFAREVAGIQGKSFQNPSWIESLEAEFDHDGSMEAPNIVIEDPILSDRFQAVTLKGVDDNVKSPVQLQTYLARSGVRPISASVDVSNYLMLLTGQPSHTYDYDKLKEIAGDDFSVRVRLARKGEKLTLLDGKEVTLDTTDIVIAAGDTAVGLAGIMGGHSTKVDSSTKSVLLEVATFNLYNMRSSQMRHGIFSEAVTRFTKGVPPALSAPVLNEAVRMISEYTGGRATGSVVEDYPGKHDDVEVGIHIPYVNKLLGTQFSSDDIVELLSNVGFNVAVDGLNATIKVPYWRKDIYIPEDIIEEVGRLAGFDTINPTSPHRDFIAVKPSEFDSFRSKLRSRLVRSGANEVLTYSFVHGDLLRKVGQDPQNSYKIVNSISPELQYYRQSLIPSLLVHISPNIKAGYDSFAIFEANKVHQKSNGLNDENVPVESDSLALVVTKSKTKGAAYYDAKQHLEYTVSVYGINLEYRSLDDDSPETAPFEPKRSASVFNADTGTKIGVVGEFKKSVQKVFKLPAYSAGFEVSPRALQDGSSATGVQYEPLSRYPGSERDVCFQVSNDVLYVEVDNAARTALAKTELISEVGPLDIYQEDGSDTKNITLRFKVTSYDKTMTTEEVSLVINGVIQHVTETTGGKVI